MEITQSKDKVVEISPMFDRVKGASWFPLLYDKDVIVLGQGGIGSWLSLFLSRLGCRIHTFDMDVYEVHNMTGQFVTDKCMGRNKARACKDLISVFSPNAHVTCYSEYTRDSFTDNIVLCALDDMASRKIAFEKWENNITTQVSRGAHPSDFFFQDGRLLAEQLQILNLSGENIENLDEYRKNWLFGNGEAIEANCTFKQTSHCAGMIASHMVGFLTNWAYNSARIKEHGVPIRALPFKYEYLIPGNLTLSK